MNAYYAARAEIEGQDPFGPATRHRKPEIGRAPRPSASVEAEVLENALLLRGEGLSSPQIAAVMRLYHGVNLRPSESWRWACRNQGAEPRPRGRRLGAGS